MVQYYTLQEAAARLQVSPEQLKEMAKKNEVRAFQDRGTLRFRAQEIDELARVRGLSSDPELQFGDIAEFVRVIAHQLTVDATQFVRQLKLYPDLNRLARIPLFLTMLPAGLPHRRSA